MEGDVDVGNRVEELGPKGGLVHGLVLAVAADQGHLGRLDKMLVGHKLVLSPAAPHRIKTAWKGTETILVKIAAEVFRRLIELLDLASPQTSKHGGLPTLEIIRLSTWHKRA